MSSTYAQYWRAAAAAPPASRLFGLFIAGWAVVIASDIPPPGRREISMEEWSATPGKYLKHPDLHPERLTKFPGSKQIPDYRAELFKKAGYSDAETKAAAGHGHH